METVLTNLLYQVLDWIVPICEIMAVVVILISVGTAFFFYIRNMFTPDERDVKINLMSGLSLGLEFAMAAEILKTIEHHNLEDLLLLGGVIVMRVILALTIHFELKDHKKSHGGQVHSGQGNKHEDKNAK